jgi:hypothetical protein
VTDFGTLLGALSDSGVAFVVIGGVAATIHGSARLTQDVDVCYERSEANLTRIVKALAPFKPYLRGAPAGLPFEWSIERLRAGLNFTLTTDVGDIDLFGEVVGGGRYEDLIGNSITVTLFGQTTQCLNLDWLIRTKRAAGRARDLEAIAELEALREEAE